MTFAIFQNEKSPFQAIKTRSSKVGKLTFFQTSELMILVQKRQFFQLFFLRNIGQENDFCDILNRKNAFVGYKNKNFKKLKNLHFSKGVNSWFQSKNGHFFTFFFQAIQARKMTFTIFQNEKTPFQAIKTRTSKSRKIDIFPKGLTHGFGRKMAIFPTFFFRK